MWLDDSVPVASLSLVLFPGGIHTQQETLPDSSVLLSREDCHQAPCAGAEREIPVSKTTFFDPPVAADIDPPG